VLIDIVENLRRNEMNRDKQIDEMRNDVEHIHRCFLEDDYDHFDEYIAVRLFEKGYRKASDVASEIIDILKSVGIDEWRYPVIAEIKNKYTEEGK
jgi:hypothetical protein